MGNAARFNLATQYAASGKAMPAWLISQLTPSDMGTITGYEKMPAGSVLHGAYGTKTSYTKTWAPPSLAAQSAWQQYLAGSASPLIGPVPRGATRPSTPSSSAKLFASLGPAQQSFVETSSAFPKALGVSGTAATAFVNSMARATTMRTAGGEDKAMVNAEGQLIAAAVKQQDAADHFKESATRISNSAKQYAAEFTRLITSANDQTTAANTTQTAANNLNNSAAALAVAANDLKGAASNIQTTSNPQNLHATVTTVTRQHVARK